MTALILSALFAAIVAVLVTLAIERFGGHRGGLLGTLPSTIVPAAIGLHIASPSIEAFEASLLMTPLGMFFNAVFLLCWRVLPVRLPPAPTWIRLGLCCAISLSCWAALASAGIWVMPRIHTLGLDRWSAGGLVFMLGLAVGVLACIKNPPGPSATTTVGPLTLAARGLLAGAAIGASIWLAEHAGPHIAGLAAVFPAIFMTTMVSLWWTHGETVGAGAVGPMMLGGTSVSGFALCAAVLIPNLGPVFGSIAAWVIAVAVVTTPSWWWMSKQRHSA
jgi:hypothetical protein